MIAKLLAIIAVIIVLVGGGIFGIGKIGFGNRGAGNGGANTEAIVNKVSAEQTSNIPPTENVIVKITVKQDKYFIDDEEKSISEIKKVLSDDSKQYQVYVIENFAATTAWDKIINELKELGIEPIIEK